MNKHIDECQIHSRVMYEVNEFCGKFDNNALTSYLTTGWRQMGNKP